MLFFLIVFTTHVLFFCFIVYMVFHKILCHLRCVYDRNYMVKVKKLNRLNVEQYKNYFSKFELTF